MADYSHTKLSTFEQCKYKYKLQYIDRVSVDKTKSIELFLGSRVHEALEKLYRDKFNCKVDSLEEILDYFETIWRDNYDESVTIVKEEYTEQNYLDQGRSIISDYYRSHEPFNDMKVIGLETTNVLRLPNGRTYDVRMDKLACKGSEYYVCDYKTDRHLKTQDEADSDRQLAMYSLWVRQNYGDATKIHLVWHMLRFDKDVVSERTDEQLDQLVRDVTDLISEIESCTEWPTEPSSRCDYCEYKRHCPEFRHMFVIEEETPEQLTKDEAYNAVNECAELDLQIKELKSQSDALKERKAALEGKVIDYARSNGFNAVYGSKMKLSVKRDDTVTVPEDNKAALKDLLIERGKAEYLQISSSRLYADVRKGMAEGDIADLCAVEESYKASLSKAKADKDDGERER